MIGGKTSLISKLKVVWEHMITCKRFQLVKEMIAQLVLYCPFFKEHYKMIAIDLSKQQALHADPKEGNTTKLI